MTVDLLCKVVDNFGDIGVVYRLARALAALDPALALRLVVDDLQAFHALDPRVDPDLPLQQVHGWTVAAWQQAAAPFRLKPPRLVVECFACGRPDWFEELLFDPRRPEPRLIVNLEHLTAESYAPEFHRHPSLTRLPLVRKFFFMPGFTPGTGGLIACRRPGTDRSTLLARIRTAGLPPSPNPPDGAGIADLADRFWLPVFSYEQDFDPLVADLARFNAERPLLVLAAAGRSAPGLLAAWERARRPFPLLALPFLPQEVWDDLLAATDFAVVRGEDSLSRAALSGRPFLWHAYPLVDDHQLVKVQALLDELRPHLVPSDFSSLANLYLSFNRGALQTGDLLTVLRSLDLTGSLGAGFADWAEKLPKNGDLAAALLTFLRDFG